MSWFAKHELQNITRMNEAMNQSTVQSLFPPLQTCVMAAAWFTLPLSATPSHIVCMLSPLYSLSVQHTHNVVGWFLSIIKVYYRMWSGKESMGASSRWRKLPDIINFFGFLMAPPPRANNVVGVLVHDITFSGHRPIFVLSHQREHSLYASPPPPPPPLHDKLLRCKFSS